MAGLAIGSDEKKKLYILGGLLAAIGVVIVVLYLPKGSGKTSNTPTAIPTPANPTVAAVPGNPGAGAGGVGNGAGTTTASAAPGTVNAASLVSVQSFRDDPFAPFARPPLPPLPPIKTSGGSGGVTSAGPVEIPSPEQISISPDSDGGSGTEFPAGGGLPPMGVNPSTPAARPLADMPPVRLPMRPNIPSTPGPVGAAGAAGITESPNKRVSGVIIGDSVRASIEITDGETKTTRIVQPGDEIDGIRILRIERATQAGRTVTRVIIRENGEERSIVLKPAPKVATTTTTKPRP